MATDEFQTEENDEQYESELTEREEGTLAQSPKYFGFYQDLRTNIRSFAVSRLGKQHKWLEYLMLAPDLFHLLVSLTLEKGVPIAAKTKLVAGIAYFISPADMMPEGIMGPIAFIDDVALAAFIVHTLVNTVPEELIQKHWAGDGDALELVRDILRVADDMIRTGIWKKIKGMFR